MNKLTKRLAAIGAAMTMAVSVMSMGASAQYTKKSSTGAYGTMSYYLYATGKHYGQGIDYYYHYAKTIQYKVGSNYVPIRKTNFSSSIALKNGSYSTSTGSSTNKDAIWSSNKIASSAVVNTDVTGTVTINVTSDHYGNITATLTNVDGKA